MKKRITVAATMLIISIIAVTNISIAFNEDNKFYLSLSTIDGLSQNEQGNCAAGLTQGDLVEERVRLVCEFDITFTTVCDAYYCKAGPEGCCGTRIEDNNDRDCVIAFERACKNL